MSIIATGGNVYLCSAILTYRTHSFSHLFLLSLRCHIRVIDTFGTEPAYNHEDYATLHGYRTNWGYWNLNCRQYMTMFRE